ncbi:MAG: response regulator transcription factor [Actinomycetota bacterium]
MKLAPVSRPSPARTVLVVDDEAALVDAVRARLVSEGYLVRVAADGPSALAEMQAHRPDLVVLDLMLPGMDGLEVCREIQKHDWVPVLMLTARADETDKIAGFAVGADDYLTKPFSLRELAARVKAILRRIERAEALAAALAPADVLQRFDLRIDISRRRVERAGVEVILTPLEFDILLTLAQTPGVVMAREQLMERVWGYWDHAGGRVVDSHVARLRRKLRDEAAEPRYIRTVHWVGYTFCEEPGA